MISPTGLGIRNDQAGFGYFNAPRRNKKHKGTDFLCNPGVEVVFPFEVGKILDLSWPYRERDLGGVYGQGLERGKLVFFKMWYFQPRDDILQINLSQGETIGVAQDVTVRYPGQEMQPHVHFQIVGIDPEILLEENYHE